MGRFCLKLLLFAALQGLLFAIVLWRHDVSHETNYLAATVHKHERLARVSSPKLVIAGGSNVPFGIQSPALEEGLGRPVVNMGLVAGVGIEYMLKEVSQGVRAGDMVLLSIEYDRLAGGFNPRIVSELIEFRPANVFSLSLGHVRKVLLDQGLEILGGIVRRSTLFGKPALPPLTSGEAFNAWGDLISHHSQEPRISVEEVTAGKLLPDQRTYPSPEVLELLANFTHRCQTRGIRVLYTFPPFALKPLEREGVRVSHIAAALKSVPYLQVIDTPFSQTYPPEFFFDTGYHLTRRGGEERTQRILQSIRSAN